jgi:hypothetical protein
VVYVAVVLVSLAVVAVAAWAARSQVPSDVTLPCSTERLGIREPHDAPYGPPNGF